MKSLIRSEKGEVISYVIVLVFMATIAIIGFELLDGEIYDLFQDLNRLLGHADNVFTAPASHSIGN